MKAFFVFLALGILLCGCGGSDAPQSPTAFLGALQHKRVGSVDYAYYRFGHGKPLLLVNAFGMTNANWGTALLQELGKRYEVITFDNRGIGLSTDSSPDALTVDSMAQSTLDLIDALELPAPDILCWSLGTNVALTMARDHSSKVGRLILVGGDPGSPNAVPPTDHFLEVTSQPSPSVADVMSILFPPGHQPEIDAYLASVEAMPPDPTTPDQRDAQLGAFAGWQQAGVWDDLSSITSKTLILHGTEDEGSPIVNGQNMANRMPNAMLVQFPNAGHAVLFQQQSACLSLIHSFLSE